ncbi:MAG: hypothetical protein H0U81_06565 [Pyrinomonadaceae bacterium]|nr:hypothetical protein [Pyrinomonadaceae bacterium]MDQ3686009.1 hypothetical protein [Acidobacteriota bacterium]
MPDEEVNKKFDVVAGHLATLAVGMQELQETQSRAEKRWERTEESIRSLLAISEIHEREIATLSAAQGRTDKQLAETDERLNIFINTVERLISEGRNGKP